MAQRVRPASWPQAAPAPTSAGAGAATAGRPHSRAEDGYGLAIGCILIVLGLMFLKAAGLVTGGIAGIALLLSYLLPLPAGVIFTIINIPFFVFAQRTMGRAFAIKTMLVNGGIAVFASLARLSIRVVEVHPAFAAIVGGTVIGMGILCVARHRAGVGGTGVVALWLLRTRGWNAGVTQMAFDVVVLAVAAPVIGGEALGWSVLSAVAISAIMIAWHRPGRYIGH